MPYSKLADILGEISGDTLLQLIVDSGYGQVTLELVTQALAGDELTPGADGADPTADAIAAAKAAAAAFTKCLERASAKVDGQCSSLYNVPFATVPPFVAALDLDVAIYNLYSRRENVPENRKDRYANAVKDLQAIGNGTIQLGVSGPAAPEQLGQTIAVTGPASIFTEDRLRNY